MSLFTKLMLSTALISLVTGCEVEFIDFSPDRGKATGDLRAAFITPLAVMKNPYVIEDIIERVAKSPHYNAVCVVLDLQSGRDYIFPGRDATSLNMTTAQNLGRITRAGLSLVLIVRNDWAARTGTGAIPSVGGQVGNDGFYSPEILEREKKFLSALKPFYGSSHIQINFEPSSPLSAPFALEMAKHLRSEGFANWIIVNPVQAQAAHNAIRGELAALGVVWATSINSGVTTGDTIFNSDGNRSINSENFEAFIEGVKAQGKPYIIWAEELSTNPGFDIPDVYF